MFLLVYNQSFVAIIVCPSLCGREGWVEGVFSWLQSVISPLDGTKTHTVHLSQLLVCNTGFLLKKKHYSPRVGRADMACSKTSQSSSKATKDIIQPFGLSSGCCD